MKLERGKLGRTEKGSPELQLRDSSFSSDLSVGSFHEANGKVRRCFFLVEVVFCFSLVIGANVM